MKKIEVYLQQDKIFQCLNILKRYTIIDEYVVSEVKEKCNKKIVIEYRGQKYETETLEEFTKIEAIVDEDKVDEVIEHLCDILKSGSNIEKIIVYDVIDTVPRVKKMKKVSKSSNVNISNIESGILSRDELLKQLGIKEPDEDFIENILKETFGDYDKNTLTEDEIKDIGLEIENEIDKNVLSILKDQDLIEDYILKVKIEKFNDKYVCDCDVIIIQKKSLGIIKKPIKTEPIKKRILDILNSKPYNLEYKVSFRLY